MPVLPGPGAASPPRARPARPAFLSRFSTGEQRGRTGAGASSLTSPSASPGVAPTTPSAEGRCPWAGGGGSPCFRNTRHLCPDQKCFRDSAPRRSLALKALRWEAWNEGLCSQGGVELSIENEVAGEAEGEGGLRGAPSRKSKVPLADTADEDGKLRLSTGPRLCSC